MEVDTRRSTNWGGQRMSYCPGTLPKLWRANGAGCRLPTGSRWSTWADTTSKMSSTYMLTSINTVPVLLMPCDNARSQPQTATQVNPAVMQLPVLWCLHHGSSALCFWPRWSPAAWTADGVSCRARPHRLYLRCEWCRPCATVARRVRQPCAVRA